MSRSHQQRNTSRVVGRLSICGSSNKNKVFLIQVCNRWGMTRRAIRELGRDPCVVLSDPAVRPLHFSSNGFPVGGNTHLVLRLSSNKDLRYKSIIGMRAYNSHKHFSPRLDSSLYSFTKISWAPTMCRYYCCFVFSASQGNKGSLCPHRAHILVGWGGGDRK